MGKRSLFLVVSISAVTVAALAQEIVIEPTNGRAQQSKVKVTRPAAVESTPAKQTEVKEAPKPKPEAHIVTKAPARKASLKQASAKPKPVAPPPAMAEPAPAKVEAPAPAAPPKKEVPTRPAWAATDTRDARALQAEIANALARDPKLQGSSIKVTVDDSA